MSHRSLALALGLAAAVIATSLLVRAARGRASRGRLAEGALGSAAALLALGFLLLVLEIGFARFAVQSDGFGHTLAARSWFARHWGPANSHGFRDAEPAAQGRRLFVVGDSFVAGHGVARRADRFADRLAPHLAPGWSVLNFARNGWDTGQQLAALRAFPLAPDALVWSYYVNDIAGAAARHGRSLAAAPHEPPALLGRIVGASHLVNFVYWRGYRLANGRLAAERWRAQRGGYADERVWRTHRAELEAAIAFARERGAPLLAVIFPHLRDAEGSRAVTQRVAEVFREGGARVLDLTDLVAAADSRRLVVNAVDAHPNEHLHAEVAARLLPLLAAGGIAQPAVAGAPPAAVCSAPCPPGAEGFASR